MASFTDTTPQFTPYISQLPIEAMVKVGMAKQKRYDEGIQRIQSQIDNIAGMDVIRDIDKTYLQSKLNELGSKLKTVAAGDFSNYQLVNSVGGMTNQIIKDRNIQNAVSSTAWYREQRKKIQKDVDEGKSDPSNIYNFDKAANKWLMSPNAGEQFNSSYVPHFDVFKFAKETFDAVQPDGFTFDKIYQLGADGKPVVTKTIGKDGKVEESLVYSPTMTRIIQEGRFPKKVQDTITQIFSDPRVGRQLQITGEYNYKDYDEATLIQQAEVQKRKLLNNYEDRLVDLNAQKNSGADVQADIDAVEKQIKSIETNYPQHIAAIKNNPDYVRGTLYKDDVFSRYTTMFGKITSKQEVLQNPAWNAEFEMQKEANAQSRWAQTEQRQRMEHADDMAYKKASLTQAWDIAVLNASTKKPGSLNKKTTTDGLGDTQDVSKFTQANQLTDMDVTYLHEKEVENAATDFISQSTGFIWNNAGFGSIPANQRRISALMNSGKTEQEAQATIIKELADRRNISTDEFMASYINKATKNYNNLSLEQKQKFPAVVDQYEAFKKSQRIYTTMMDKNKEIAKQQALLYGKTQTKKDYTEGIPDRVYKVGNQEVKVTKDDIYDLAVYLRGHLSIIPGAGGRQMTIDATVKHAADAAEERLRQRGKGDFLDPLLDANYLTRVVQGGPITAVGALVSGAFRKIKGIGAGALGLSGPTLNGADSDELYKNVGKVLELINNDKFGRQLENRADVIKKNYNIAPNLQAPIFTGEAETDRDLLYTLKTIASGYSKKGGGRLNASSDFEQFQTDIGTAQTSNDIPAISAMPTVDGEGRAQVEIVTYDKDLKRSGGVTIQADEAAQLGIDLNTLYEGPEIRALRDRIKNNRGKSSNGDPSDVVTYKNGDSYFHGSDFPILSKQVANVQGNFVFKNGKYYPYLYIDSGQPGGQRIRQLEGSPNLGAATRALLEADARLATIMLHEKY